MRRKPNLESRLELCGHLLVTQPEEQRGCWLKGSAFNELHIELGCGKGRFTVEMAKSRPDTLFIALEKTANVLVIALERAAQEGLHNVYFINDLADNLTDYFAPGEVSKIYINFCDPWPANRHAKRRLTGQRFLDLYRNVLCHDGDISFKTDDLPLFEFSLSEFERCGFELPVVIYDIHKNGFTDVMTDYESKFYEQGKPIYKCVIKDKL